MARIIRTNGNSEQLNDNSLTAWQDAVGGYVEPVYGTDFVMLVNEEGLLIGLPVNVEASRIANRVLVGDAIHFTLKEWEDANN